MSAAPDAREALIGKLFALFRERGYEGVSIADISSATGLGKSSLYHHFPGGKEEMAEAVIAFTRRVLEQRMFAPLLAPAPVEAKIDAMLDELRRVYSDGSSPCVIAALSAGGGDNPLARGTGALFRDWVEAIAGAVRETGVAAPEAERRARAMLSLFQGALVMTRALNDTAAFQEALGLGRDVLLRPKERSPDGACAPG